MGALAATGQALRKYKYEPLAPGFLHVAPPENYRKPKKGMSIEDLNIQRAQEFEEKIIWEQKETIAGILWSHLSPEVGFLYHTRFILRESKKSVIVMACY